MTRERSRDAERPSQRGAEAKATAPGKQTMVRARGAREERDAVRVELEGIVRERAPQIVSLDERALEALQAFVARHPPRLVASLALDGELLALLRQLDASPQPLQERWRGLFALLRGEPLPKKEAEDPRLPRLKSLALELPAKSAAERSRTLAALTGAGDAEVHEPEGRQRAKAKLGQLFDELRVPDRDPVLALFDDKEDPAAELRRLATALQPGDPKFGERALALVRQIAAPDLQALQKDERVLAALRASPARDRLAKLLGLELDDPEQKRAPAHQEEVKDDDARALARRIDRALEEDAERPFMQRDPEKLRAAVEAAQSAARRAQALREENDEKRWNAPRADELLEKVTALLERRGQLHGANPRLAQQLEPGAARDPEPEPLLQRLERQPPRELIADWADQAGNDGASDRRRLRAASKGRLRPDRVEALERELSPPPASRVLARLRKRLAELAAEQPEMVELEPEQPEAPEKETKEGNQRGRE